MITSAKRKVGERALAAILCAVFIVGAVAFLAKPAAAQSVTSQTVDLTPYVHNSAQWISYDSATNYAWISQGISNSTLTRVAMGTVKANTAGSVSTFTSIFGASSNGCGSPADGAAASVALAGDLYVTGWYNDNCAAVAQVSESTGSVLNTWYYYNSSLPTCSGNSGGSGCDSRGIATDGASLYLCAQDQIVKMSTAGAFMALATISGDCTSVLINAGTVYFTEAGGSYPAGQVSTAGSSLSQYSCSGCTEGIDALYEGGSLWVSSNQAHTLLQFRSGILNATYPTGLAGDGPYGLVYDASNAGLWVDGYGAISTSPQPILFFSLASDSFISADQVTTTDRPYYGFVDSSGNVWNMALGSTELVEIQDETTTSTYVSTVTTTSTSTFTEPALATSTSFVSTVTVPAYATVTTTIGTITSTIGSTTLSSGSVCTTGTNFRVVGGVTGRDWYDTCTLSDAEGWALQHLDVVCDVLYVKSSADGYYSVLYSTGPSSC